MSETEIERFVEKTVRHYRSMYGSDSLKDDMVKDVATLIEVGAATVSKPHKEKVDMIMSTLVSYLMKSGPHTQEEARGKAWEALEGVEIPNAQGALINVITGKVVEP